MVLGGEVSPEKRDRRQRDRSFDRANPSRPETASPREPPRSARTRHVPTGARPACSNRTWTNSRSRDGAGALRPRPTSGSSPPSPRVRLAASRFTSFRSSASERRESESFVVMSLCITTFFDRRRWPWRGDRSPTGRFCWEPCRDALCGQRRRFMRRAGVRSGSRAGCLPEAVKRKIDSLEEFFVVNVAVAPFLPERSVLPRGVVSASAPDTDATGSNPQGDRICLRLFGCGSQRNIQATRAGFEQGLCGICYSGGVRETGIRLRRNSPGKSPSLGWIVRLSSRRRESQHSHRRSTDGHTLFDVLSLFSRLNTCGCDAYSRIARLTARSFCRHHRDWCCHGRAPAYSCPRRAARNMWWVKRGGFSPSLASNHDQPWIAEPILPCCVGQADLSSAVRVYPEQLVLCPRLVRVPHGLVKHDPLTVDRPMRRQFAHGVGR